MKGLPSLALANSVTVDGMVQMNLLSITFAEQQYDGVL